MGAAEYLLSKANDKRKKEQKKVKDSAFHKTAFIGKTVGKEAGSLVEISTSGAKDLASNVSAEMKNSSSDQQESDRSSSSLADVKKNFRSTSLLEKSMGSTASALEIARKKSDERVGNLLMLTGHTGLAMVHKTRSSIQTKTTDAAKETGDQVKDFLGDER